MENGPLITPPANKQLGVASWNTEKVDQERVFAEVGRMVEDPNIAALHVLGLQGIKGEMTLEGDFRLPRIVRKLAHYAARSSEYIDGWKANGVALLSSLALRRTTDILLSTHQKKIYRHIKAEVHQVCQLSELEWDGATLTIIHPHLSAISQAPKLRRKEHAQLVEIVQGISGSAILLGNLNVGVNSELVQRLQEKMVPAETQLEATWCPFLGSTAIGTRSDYVFASPDLKLVASGVHHTGTRGHQPVWASVERVQANQDLAA